MEKLDKERIKYLLQKADDKWFNSPPKKGDYHAHLSFTADYIAKNYNKESKKKHE